MKNTGVLSYTDLNAGTFHRKLSEKVTFVNITTDSIRKALKNCEAVRTWWQIQYFEILICAWKVKWCHWQQILCVVVLEMCLLHSSSSKRPPNPAVWKASLSAVPGYKNGAAWETQLVQLPRRKPALPLRPSLRRRGLERFLCGNFLFHHTQDSKTRVLREGCLWE